MNKNDDAIDKPITRVDLSRSKEMGPGILGDAPIKSDPHGAVISGDCGQPGTQSDPFAMRISKNVRRALDKQPDDVRRRVNEFVVRKG